MTAMLTTSMAVFLLNLGGEIWEGHKFSCEGQKVFTGGQKICWKGQKFFAQGKSTTMKVKRLFYHQNTVAKFNFH